MMRTLRTLSILIVASLFVSVSLLRAGELSEASETLLRHVPKDMQFCLLVEDLREHEKQLLASPLMKKVTASPLGTILKAVPKIAPIAELEKLSQKHLGITLKQLRDDVIGDAIVIAYRHRNEPPREEGLVMTYARKPELLKQIVTRWQKLAPFKKRQHAGVNYLHLQNGTETVCLSVQGSLFLFSDQESLLREAIDQSRAKTSRLLEQFQSGRQPHALATLWINPRSFDVELKKELQRTRGPEVVFLKAFVEGWKHLNGLMCGLSLHEDIELSMSYQVDEKGLPEPLQKFVTELVRPSALWKKMPEDAIYATAFRIETVALIESFLSLQDTDTKKSLHRLLNQTLGLWLGRNVLKEVAPNIGPDWGSYIVGPRKGSTGWTPQLLFALRVKAGDRFPPMDQSLLTWLRISIAFGINAYNQANSDDPLTWENLKVEQENAMVLTSNQGKELGIAPTFGLTGGYLVIASSPDAWKDFALREEKSIKFTGTPLMRFSFSALRAYLQNQQQPLKKFLAKQNNVEEKVVAQNLQVVQMALKWFDSIELNHHKAEDWNRLSLRLRMSYPLQSTP